MEAARVIDKVHKTWNIAALMTQEFTTCIGKLSSCQDFEKIVYIL